jgi:hypothetical protein
MDQSGAIQAGMTSQLPAAAATQKQNMAANIAMANSGVQQNVNQATLAAGTPTGPSVSRAELGAKSMADSGINTNTQEAMLAANFPGRVADTGTRSSGILENINVTDPLQQDYQTDFADSPYYQIAQDAHRVADRDIDVFGNRTMNMARENAIQAGFQPGTQEFERMVDRAAGQTGVQGLEARNAAVQTSQGAMRDQIGLDRADYEFDRNRSAQTEDWMRNVDLGKVQEDAAAGAIDDRQIFSDFQGNPAAYTELVRARAAGEDINKAVTNMFDPATGTLKPEFIGQDPYQQQVESLAQRYEASGMSPEEATARANEFYITQIETQDAPVEEGKEAYDTGKRLQGTIDSQAFRNGDYSGLTQTDWTEIRLDNDLAKRAGVLSSPSPGLGKNDFETAAAVKQAAAQKGLVSGAIVEHNGQLYQIDDTHTTSASAWGGLDDRTNFAVWATPLEGGGGSKSIYSKEFDIG